LFEDQRLTPDSWQAELGSTVGDALLAPHRSYLAAVSPLLDAQLVKGMAHITGGGITENLPRVLPDNCGATIHRQAWPVPPIFTLLETLGRIEKPEMYRSFNMGIGLIVVCAADQAPQLVELLADNGERETRVIGEVTRGDRTVRYE
jgi:phosphoribosylformylglycinamidine cyclo-ligase